MKLHEVAEPKAETKYTYRQNGDGSHTVRVERPDGRVFVHTNKKKSELDKIVQQRYS